MPLDSEIIVVSGLPRSGTSLMVQMLDRGGIPVLSDGRRTPDVDNPRGYYEDERVTRSGSDCSWVPDARGKAVKVVSPLLVHLPAEERYRVVFVHRDLDEVIASQEKMLARRGKPAGPHAEARAAFEAHLREILAWLESQPHLRLLSVGYGDLLAAPRREAQRIRDFLDGRPDVERMLAAIDPSLYRHRAGALASDGRHVRDALPRRETNRGWRPIA